MTIGEYRDEDGKTLYEKYSGDFEAKGLVNVGFVFQTPIYRGLALK